MQMNEMNEIREDANSNEIKSQIWPSRSPAQIHEAKEGAEDGIEIKRTVTKSEKEISGSGPHFDQYIQSEVVKVGGSVKFECKVMGDPLPTVVWFKGDIKLEMGGRIKLESNDSGVHSLTLSDIQSADDGKYTVRASNNFGESCCTATLLIREGGDDEEEIITKRTVTKSAAEAAGSGPHFDQYTQSEVVKIGGVAKLECKVRCDPTPTLTWFKGDTKLESGDRIKIDSTAAGVYTLTISDIRSSEDGKYTVKANNDFGESHCTTTLLVGEPGEDDKVVIKRTVVSSSASSVVSSSASKSEEISEDGSQVTIKKSTAISSSGLQEAEVEEEAEEEEVKTKLETIKGKSDVSEKQESVVTVVSSSAETDDKKAEEAFATRSVESEKSIKIVKGSAPSFQQFMNSLAVAVGGDAKFECSIIGDPAPRITWLKSKASLGSSDKILIEALSGAYSLTLKGVNKDDAGQYTVMATNDFGEISCTATLNVHDHRENIELQIEEAEDKIFRAMQKLRTENLSVEIASWSTETNQIIVRHVRKMPTFEKTDDIESSIRDVEKDVAYIRNTLLNIVPLARVVISELSEWPTIHLTAGLGSELLQISPQQTYIGVGCVTALLIS